MPVNFDRLIMGTKVLKWKDDKENTGYLDLLLDHKLTWGSHIKELNKKKTSKILAFSAKYKDTNIQIYTESLVPKINRHT